MKPEYFDRIINAAREANSAHADGDVMGTAVALKRVASRTAELAGETSVRYASWLNEADGKHRDHTTEHIADSFVQVFKDAILDGTR